jgi:hypothetical protein
LDSSDEDNDGAALARNDRGVNGLEDQQATALKLKK